jgi:type VI secretion system protein ImpA
MPGAHNPQDRHGGITIDRAPDRFQDPCMDGLPEDFDLDALLAPFDENGPTGPDLREDLTPQSPYFRLRDARAEARAEEREADKNSTDIALPQAWRVVRQLALETIARRSKDLEMAAWLTEAALRMDGLPGFTAGARLMGGLVERFWDGLYPLPDEEGIETRVAPVTGLNGSGGDGTLVQPLRKLILFRRRDGEPLPFWEYEQSAAVEAMKEADRAQRHAAGLPAFKDLQEDARAAPKAALAALRRQADAALAAWATLGERLDAAAGADSPPTGRIRELLAQIRKIADTYAPPDLGEPVEAVADDPATPAAAAGTAAPGAPVASGTAISREDMLRDLARIADYFRRTEPHSPLAYTLEEAVRRGRMSWPELLQEIMPDPATRNQMLTTLGIRPEPEAE